jgi:hypothetical protein
MKVSVRVLNATNATFTSAFRAWKVGTENMNVNGTYCCDAHANGYEGGWYPWLREQSVPRHAYGIYSDLLRDYWANRWRIALSHIIFLSFTD